MRTTQTGLFHGTVLKDTVGNRYLVGLVLQVTTCTKQPHARASECYNMQGDVVAYILTNEATKAAKELQLDQLESKLRSGVLEITTEGGWQETTGWPLTDRTEPKKEAA